jgi:hypothetical protein
MSREVRQLAALFTGDPLVPGEGSFDLALLLCHRLEPRTAEELELLVYRHADRDPKAHELATLYWAYDVYTNARLRCGAA